MSSDEKKPLDEETKQLIVEGYRKTNKMLGFDPVHEAEKQELKNEIKELTSQITIKNYEESKKKAESAYPPPAPKGGDTAPLNPPSDNFKQSSNLLDREFESEQAAYAEISRLAKQGNSEAQAIERQLFNKLRKDGLDYEFYGDSHALYRTPKPITPDMTKEQIEYTKQKNSELMAEKAKWRKVQ